MIEIILFLVIGLLTVFVFSTMWYHKQCEKKYTEVEFFTYHYIQLRLNKKDTAIAEAEKYDDYKEYKQKILAWEKPRYPSDKSDSQKEQ